MFYNFRNTFFEQICFSHHQIRLVFPNFDSKNLSRWLTKGYIVKLRNGLYTFPEHLNKPSLNLFVANRLYQPSYISLQFALHYYGFIPEIINDITCISTLKSKQFKNISGSFTYQSVQPHMFFGYEVKKYDLYNVMMASPEKAIIDMFHIFPVYNTAEDMAQLRFDKAVLKENLNSVKLDEFLCRFGSKVLTRRIGLMKKVYAI